MILGLALLGLDALRARATARSPYAGLIALGFGLATMFQNVSGGPQRRRSALIVAVTLVLGGAWAFGISKAIAARRSPVAVGPQEIIGMEGVVREGGLVSVHGELWRARADRAAPARAAGRPSTGSTG